MLKEMMVTGVVAAAVAACGPPAQAPNVYVNTQAASSAAAGAGAGGADVTGDDVADASEPMLSPTARKVIVLVDKRVDRPTEVLGVFDFHSAATSEDKGFDELRRRAAEIGADAVIGAEFEHGDDGGPSHLSGMAVRFLDH